MAHFGSLNSVCYGLVVGFARLTVRPYLRLCVEGEENLPAGACIVAPNHTSYLDPVVLQTVLPRRLVFLMNREWYDIPVLHALFRLTKCIPVEKRGSNRRALEGALLALRQGASVGIFPEGRLTAGAGLGDFSRGAASLALRAHVPIVPTAILGTARAMPRGRGIPRPFAVTVRIGVPLVPPSGQEMSGMSRRRIIMELTARVRTAVAELARD